MAHIQQPFNESADAAQSIQALTDLFKLQTADEAA